MSVKMQNSSSDILETGKREKREKREWQAESPVVIGFVCGFGGQPQ